jgi:hypothetical protein
MRAVGSEDKEAGAFIKEFLAGKTNGREHAIPALA